MGDLLVPKDLETNLVCGQVENLAKEINQSSSWRVQIFEKFLQSDEVILSHCSTNLLVENPIIKNQMVIKIS